MSTLTKQELVKLIQAVFPHLPQDNALAVLVDVPRKSKDDTDEWARRRQLALDWTKNLSAAKTELQLNAVALYAYSSVESNNADLPELCSQIETVPSTAADLENETSFNHLFENTQLFLAPTQFSTTAPMKVAAKKYNFRAATMPGFSTAMVPALRIDYAKVNERCLILKDKLDQALAAHVVFDVQGKEYKMSFDLRFRSAHASSGRFPEPGTAGNLPSGETYIVPYEGEKDELSQTTGVLPVQFDDEVVLFGIQENRAVDVLSTGTKSKEQEQYLKREPAYGNMAELGFGFLADFGLKPIGQVLLDEKLGFHIAFGRSEHFGGDTGPDKFSSPGAVVHIDRIYIPDTQPNVSIKAITLSTEDKDIKVMNNGNYVLF